MDASFVFAHRNDGRYDVSRLIGASLPQWVAWVLGTAVGALTAPSADLMHRLGLDVVFPAFFLVLALDEAEALPPRVRRVPARRRRRRRLVAGHRSGLRAARRHGGRTDRPDPGTRSRSHRSRRGDLMKLWLAALAVTVVNWLMKAGGPLLIGERKLPPAAVRVVGLIAPGAAGRAHRHRTRRQAAGLDAARRRRCRRDPFRPESSLAAGGRRRHRPDRRGAVADLVQDASASGRRARGW